MNIVHYFFKRENNWSSIRQQIMCTFNSYSSIDIKKYLLKQFVVQFGYGDFVLTNFRYP